MSIVKPFKRKVIESYLKLPVKEIDMGVFMYMAKGRYGSILEFVSFEMELIIIADELGMNVVDLFESFVID